MIKKKYFYIREGDKSIKHKNSKKLYNTQGIKTQIFNGWTGVITRLDFTMNNVTVFFPIINDSIIFNFSDLKKHILFGI